MITRRVKNFIASQRWFHQFRSHHELTNVELSGEAASVAKDAAVKFVPRLQRLVKAGVTMIVKEGNHQELNKRYGIVK